MQTYTVRKVRLSGAYETGTGRYYGSGLPHVYRAVDRETGDYLLEIRARDREHALARILKCQEVMHKCGISSMDLVPDTWY